MCIRDRLHCAVCNGRAVVAERLGGPGCGRAELYGHAGYADGLAVHARNDVLDNLADDLLRGGIA